MRDAAREELLDSISAGEGYYLVCPNGHGSLPPRRVCPTCGDARLTETALDDVGRLCTYTVIHVASPAFAPDTPYVTAIASFGDVRVTGILRDIDAADAVIGMDVRLECAEYDNDRLLALSPA